MKKILVPTDFSTSAGHAFKFACEVASRSGGQVYLLNIIEFPRLNGALPVPVQAYEQAYLRGLKEKAAKALKKFKASWGKKLRVRFSMEHGAIVQTVARFVAQKRIDLIVMGTHGSSGIEEYIIGSNTEKIVQTSKVPVISIKRPVKVSAIKHIVFPTNLKSGQEKWIRLVKDLQKFFNAKFHVLFVNTPANFRRDVFIEKRLKEFAKENKLKNYSLNAFNDIDEEEGIINFTAHFKNSMIAMSTHGRKGLNHLFSGSVAEDVVNHIKCPVWTLAGK